MSDKKLHKLLKSLNLNTKKKFSKLNIQLLETPIGQEVEIVNLLNASPLIDFAELDIGANSNVTANDTRYASAWHLAQINMPQAWEKSKGKDIVVAVLDAGVDPSHEDLTGQVLAGRNVVSNNSDTSDLNGHGTLVAGTISALSNNNLGVTSIAWDAKILPVRISNASDGYAFSSHIAAGLTWAADNGADVANLSYDVHSSSTVATAADYFRSKGGLVVISAGNGGKELSCSAKTSLIVVSATDQNDNLASFSDYGKCIDISAPGVSIYTTHKSGGYSKASGTSFSAPITSAVIALMKAAKPSASITDIETTLKQSANKSVHNGDYSIRFGYGRIDANAALTSLAGDQVIDQLAPSVNITSPTQDSIHSEDFIVAVNAQDETEIERVELFINGGLIGTERQEPYEFYVEIANYLDHQDLSLYSVAFDSAGNYSQSDTLIINLDIIEPDTDKDGVVDSEDDFPNDPAEWNDSDLDGVGDNADAFPNDVKEWQDSDLDGVGDNADAFPNDVKEWQDSDLDGVGDNADAFPNDVKEWQDSDLDGVGDNADTFPNDVKEWQDSDLDGVGDNADAFPNDVKEWQDSDLDGVGDNADAFPNDPSKTEPDITSPEKPDDVPEQPEVIIPEEEQEVSVPEEPEVIPTEDSSDDPLQNNDTTEDDTANTESSTETDTTNENDLDNNQITENETVTEQQEGSTGGSLYYLILLLILGGAIKCSKIRK
nr:S8 family serine peptidase [Thalassomonas sp. M1454]